MRLRCSNAIQSQRFTETCLQHKRGLPNLQLGQEYTLRPHRCGSPPGGSGRRTNDYSGREPSRAHCRASVKIVNAMSTRSFNPNRIKLRRVYSVHELAKQLGVHKNTIRQWRLKGLEPIDQGRPVLFLGGTVRTFLAKRKAERKRPCPPGTLYCFRCRWPRPPALGLLEYVPRTSKCGNVRGLCGTCDALMHRSVSRDRLAATMPGLDVQFPEAPLRLIGSPSPSLECDSKQNAAA